MLILGLSAGAGFYYAYKWHNGRALAQRLTENYNKKARGRMTIGSVKWTPRAAIDLLLGRDSKVTIYDIALYDTKGRRVAHFPKIETRGQLWPLLRDGSYHVSSAIADTGTIRIDYYKRPDRPDPISGNPFEVGLLGALEESDPLKDQQLHPTFYNFRNMHVKRLKLSFYNRYFQLHFKRIKLKGDLLVTSSTRTTRTEVRFDLHPIGGQGELRLAGKSYPLEDITAPYVRTDRDSRADLEFAVGGRLAGARFRMTSRIENLIQEQDPAIQLNATLTNFAAGLAKMTGVDVRGADEKLAFEVYGPLRSVTLQGRLSGLSTRVRVGGKTIRADDIFAQWHIAKESLTLRTLTCQTLDGTLTGTGAVDLARRSYGATFKISELKLSRLLGRKENRRLLAGKLYGSFSVKGTLEPNKVTVNGLDVTLHRSSRSGPFPRRLRLRGHGHHAAGTIHLDRLSLTGYGLKIAAKGKVGLASKRLRLTVSAELGRLSHLMRSAGLPSLARSGTLNGNLRGTFGRPRLFGALTLSGGGYQHVRSHRMAAQVTFLDGTLSFKKLQGDLLGGSLTGSGHVGLLRRGSWTLKNRPHFKARLAVTAASLKRLLPKRSVHGRFAAKLAFRGRLGALAGEGTLRLRNAVYAGQHIHAGEAALCLKHGQVQLKSIQMTWSGGGRLQAHGRYDLRNKDLALKGSVTSLPLSMLSETPAFRRILSGVLSGEFDLSGNRARPVVAAVLKLARVRVRSVLIGRGRVELSPDQGAVRIRGELFQRFRVTGRLVMHPRPAIRLTVTFHKLPLHELAPELAQLPAAVTAVASGRLDLEFDFTSGLKRFAATLTELDLKLKQLDHLPGEARKVVALRNSGAIRLSFDGQRLRIRRLELDGTAGVISARGWLSADDSELSVKGQLELARFSFLASRWVDELTGRAYVKATIKGSPRRPEVQGELILAGVRVLLPNRRVPVRIATARLHVTNHRLKVQDARISIHTEDLAVQGEIALKNLSPQKLDIRLRGKLSAQILRLIMPRTFSHVSGRALASLHLTGPVKDPKVDGRIRLEPISFTLRGSGREFGLKSGLVTISNRRIRIREVRGSVDDGSFVVDGLIRMKPSWPYDMNLTIRGQSIPVKKARSYELELNTSLRLRIIAGKASISGMVDVADGRFIENFDVVSRAFLKRRSYDQRPPFWETNNLIRNAQLNITVASHGGPLIIKNNLADIRLEGNISLRGTPQNPKIGGRIQTESGTFRIPFLRGEFTVQSGELDFDHPFGFGETYVKIVGETNYTDVSETEHDITVSLEGPLSRIAIKLSSSTGLNQSQILMLLASGRTMDQIRRQIRGRSDSGSGSSGRSSNPLDAYDSSLKQVTGDFLSQLVAQPLQAWTQLDLVRLELGTESFQVRVNKSLGRNVRLAGEAEFGLLGRQRQEGRVEVRVLDEVSVDAKARRLIPGEDTVIDEDRYQGRIELRYRIRLRTNLSRSLGF